MVEISILDQLIKPCQPFSQELKVDNIGFMFESIVASRQAYVSSFSSHISSEVEGS